MIRLLEASGTFDDLADQPEYRRLLERLAPARPSAA